MTGVHVTTGAAALPWAARNPFTSVEFLIAVGLLVLVLLAGAVVVYFLDTWRKQQFAADNDSVGTLAMYRSMFERGELTEAEYQTILAKMTPRVRQEVTAANPSLAATTAGAKPATETNIEAGGNPAGGAGAAGPEPPPPPTG